MLSKDSNERLIIRLSPSFFLQQIQEREDQDPYKVDKVPVESDVFHQIKAIRRIPSLACGYEDTGEINHPAGNVKSVEAGDHVEGGAEQRCAERVFGEAEIRPMN